jgi:ATP-binding cassette subfamily C exporter for protease/lipase
MSVHNPNSRPSELRQALQHLAPWLLRAGFFSLLAGLLILAPTGYMLEVYERVVNSRSHMTLAMLTLLVLLAFVVMEVLEWARTETLREAGTAFEQQLTPRVFTLMFEAGLKRMPGGTLQPMNDLRTLRDFFYAPAVGAVMESPVALVFLVLIFMMSPLLGWAALAGAVVQVLLAWLNERATHGRLMQANKTAMAAQAYADGSLRNAEVIEAMGMLPNIHQRWMAKQREFLGLQALASDRAGAYQAMTRFMQHTMSSMLLGLGAWLLLENSLAGGAGMMIVGSILGGRVLAPLVLLVGQWRSVVNARDAWQRLEPLLTQFPAKDPAMPLPAPQGVLQVENLVAAAPGSQVPILRGLHFHLQPGEVLAVVGPSASGKTTLARLLVGIWPPASGKVRLDGADVHAWDKQELGPHLGYVPQGVALLEGSVAENIARFGEVDMAKVQAAATAVGLDALIASLPEGFQTQIGRDGAVLSGGQRQRVALARAVYGNCRFVVLDEPNANLDEAGELALAQLIQALKAQGTTFVVMTHRSNILGVADKMLVLKEGTQQAFGPRDEVLNALKSAAQNQAPVVRGGQA